MLDTSASRFARRRLAALQRAALLAGAVSRAHNDDEEKDAADEDDAPEQLLLPSSEYMTPEEHEAAATMFGVFDRDGDGTVTVEEIVLTMSRNNRLYAVSMSWLRNVGALIQEYGLEGSQGLSLEEWTELVGDAMGVRSRAQLRPAVVAPTP